MPHHNIATHVYKPGDKVLILETEIEPRMTGVVEEAEEGIDPWMDTIVVATVHGRIEVCPCFCMPLEDK